MHYLYGTKPGAPARLIATFDSEAQLRAYVHWATLGRHEDGGFRFEQGSPLVGYRDWEMSDTLRETDEPNQVVHNPTPSML